MKNPKIISLSILFFILSARYLFPQKELIITEKLWTDFKLPSHTPLPIVNISCSFDTDAFYINSFVRDNHFKDGERSWRHGDGFYINFITPALEEHESSDKFYGFGFSMQNKKPVSVLVNKDGKYFPGYAPPPAPVIKIDSSSMTAEYKIKIPWRNLYPFHPFKNSPAGINIIYISQNDDGSRIIQKLIEDDYDTERTKFRKFIPLKLRAGKTKAEFIAGEIKERVTKSRNTTIKLLARASKPGTKFIRIEISSDKNNTIKRTIKKRFSAGINKIQATLKLPKASGLYTIKAVLNDSVFWKEDLYKYNPDTFAQSIMIIKLISDSTNSKELKLSSQTVAFHLNELKNAVENFGDRDDIYSVKEKFETLSAIMDQFTTHKTVFKNPGYLLSAFESTIDTTAQPFSIVLPQNVYDDNPKNLMVVLHGSGVDEIQNIKHASHIFSGHNFIFVAPRGRDLSSWYTGQTEMDIMDLVKIIKEVFHINKTILYGFSMGGYGAWRLGLKYPNLFDAGVAVSGSPINFKDNTPENNLNNLYMPAKKIPFLAVHGTADKSLDISLTDAFIEKLKKENHPVDYIRIEGGGHGGTEFIKVITDWFEKNKWFNQ